MTCEVAYESFPCQGVLIPGPGNHLEILVLGELWVVVLGESVVALLVIVVPRDNSQCDGVYVLPILEVKLTELPQCCRSSEDELIARPKDDVSSRKGRGNIEEMDAEHDVLGLVHLGMASQNKSISGNEVVERIVVT